MNNKENNIRFLPFIRMGRALSRHGHNRFNFPAYYRYSNEPREIRGKLYSDSTSVKISIAEPRAPEGRANRLEFNSQSKNVFRDSLYSQGLSLELGWNNKQRGAARRGAEADPGTRIIFRRRHKAVGNIV